MENTRMEVVNRVSFVTIFVNIALSVIKVIAGIFGRSGAMIADGIHSASDVVTTVIAYVGVKMASKEADEDHPYGHEKIEPVMGKILATTLIVTALFLGYQAFHKINNNELQIPNKLALSAAFLSIIVKEWMYWYTIKAAKEIDSSVLKADAWHHRSDAISSVGSLIGVGGAMMGYTILDPIASIAISVLILKVGVDIYLQSVKELIDTAADKETIDSIRKTISSVEGVRRIDNLKTRMHANRVYVDVEIAVDGNFKLFEAHEIAEKVHDKIEHENEKIKHCMVHVNPC